MRNAVVLTPQETRVPPHYRATNSSALIIRMRHQARHVCAKALRHAHPRTAPSSSSRHAADGVRRGDASRLDDPRGRDGTERDELSADVEARIRAASRDAESMVR